MNIKFITSNNQNINIYYDELTKNINRIVKNVWDEHIFKLIFIYEDDIKVYKYDKIKLYNCNKYLNNYNFYIINY